MRTYHLTTSCTVGFPALQGQLEKNTRLTCHLQAELSKE